MKTRTALLFFMCMLLISCEKSTNQKESPRDPQLVNRIDHIVIYYNSQQEVDSMINLFHNAFELPQWFLPDWRVPANQSFRFYNSGIYLGNVFFEFISFNAFNKPAAGIPPKSTNHAFAFTSDMENTGSVLDSLSVKYTRDLFLFNCSSEPDTLFTNLMLDNIWDNNLLVFFCKYHPVLFSCQESFDYGDFALSSNMEEHHEMAKNILSLSGGGKLGIKKVSKMVVGSNRYDLHRDIYDKLYSSSLSINNCWDLPDGLQMELQEATVNKIEALILEIESTGKAKEFLDLMGFEYTETNDTLILGIGNNLGLDFKLTTN